MNHRSNIDYVLLAHLMAHRTALSYAAGEWAHVWPLGRLIGGMGAFFVRRGSGDDLYRRVLERFVQMAVEGGLTQVFFPEGGLSRDGKPREPKIGLLDYMLRRFDPDVVRHPLHSRRRQLRLGARRSRPLATRRSRGRDPGPRRTLRLRRPARWSEISSWLGAVAASDSVLPPLASGYPSRRASMRPRAGSSFGALEREDRIEEVKALARLLMLGINDCRSHPSPSRSSPWP